MPRKRSHRVSSRTISQEIDLRTQACHFWNLPLELRNMIYGFAYGSGRIILPRSTKKSSYWRNLQNIDEVRLVSKQFHAEAMQHLVENNTFRLLHRNNILYRVPGRFALKIRHLFLDWSGFDAPFKPDLNQLCPKLRSLKLSAPWMLLNVLVRRTPQGTEVVIRKIASAFSLVSGLGFFKLVRPSEDREPDARPCLIEVHMPKDTSNIDLLEEAIRSIVTRAKVSRRSRLPRAAKKCIEPWAFH